MVVGSKHDEVNDDRSMEHATP